MHRLIDGHLDLAYNALGYDRDQTCALETIRRREAKLTAPTVQETRGHGDSSEEHWGTATVTLPEMRRAGIAICLATVLQRVKRDYVRMRPPPLYELDHASQQIAHAAAQGQLAYYRVLEQTGELEMIRDARTLQTVWDKHREGAQGDPLPAIGYILSIEGCDPIVSPAQAQWWWQQGLRTACLAHYGQGVYGFGTGGDGPLTADGLELLRVFEQLGVILDLAHTAETGFYQALDQFHGPVFVSHGNCQALTPGDRQLSDEQLRLVIARGGVIGVAMDAWMLHENYQRGVTPRDAVDFNTVADHIDHICQLAGDRRHVAIGSDLDGGFGVEQCPHDLDSIADLQKLDAILTARGFASIDVAAIFHGNWYRFFSETLPQST